MFVKILILSLWLLTLWHYFHPRLRNRPQTHTVEQSKLSSFLRYQSTDLSLELRTFSFKWHWRSIFTVTVSSSFCQKINTSNHLLLHNKQTQIHHCVTARRARVASQAGYRVPLRYITVWQAGGQGSESGRVPGPAEIHHCVTGRRTGHRVPPRYWHVVQHRSITVWQAGRARQWVRQGTESNWGTSLCDRKADRVQNLTEVHHRVTGRVPNLRDPSLCDRRAGRRPSPAEILMVVHAGEQVGPLKRSLVMKGGQ